MEERCVSVFTDHNWGSGAEEGGGGGKGLSPPLPPPTYVAARNCKESSSLLLPSSKRQKVPVGSQTFTHHVCTCMCVYAHMYQ